MKIFKRIFLYTILVLALIILGAHLLLRYKTKQLLSILVERVSHGKYAVSTDKVSLTYWPTAINVSALVLKPVRDTGHSITVQAERAELSLTTVIDLLRQKKLLIEKIRLEKLSFVSVSDGSHVQRNTSIQQAMGNIQRGLFRTFHELGIKHADLKSCAIRIYQSPAKDSFFSINNITLGLQEIDLTHEPLDTNRLQFKGQVWLEVVHPEIHLPNEVVRVTLDTFRYDSRVRRTTLDSVSLLYTTDRNITDSIFLSRLRISKVHWGKFLEEGFIEMDTLLIRSGLASWDFSAGRLKKEKAPSEKAAGYSGPPVLIHHVYVNDVGYKLRVELKSKKGKMVSDLALRGNNFSVNEVSLMPGRKPALDLQDFQLRFTNLSDIDRAGNYLLSLGELQLDKKNLQLSNFKFRPGNKDSNPGMLLLEIPELKLENYSLAELWNKRLVANTLTILRPVVQLRQGPPKKRESQGSTQSRSIETLISAISKKIELGKLVLQDAKVKIFPYEKGKAQVDVNDLSLTINGRKAYKARSVQELFACLQLFNISQIQLRGPNMALEATGLRLADRGKGVHVARLKGKPKENIYTDLFGVNLHPNAGLNPGSTNQHFSMQAISVDSGIITIEPMTGKEQQRTGKAASLLASNVDLNNIKIGVWKDGKMLISSLLDIKATNFGFRDKAAYWEKLEVDAAESKFQNVAAKFEAAELEIDQPGFLHIKKAKGSFANGRSKLEFESNEMNIKVGIQSSSINHLVVNGLDFDYPVLKVHLAQKGVTQKKETLKKKTLAQRIQLQELRMKDPQIELFLLDEAGERKAGTSSLSGNFYCKGLDWNPTLAVPEMKFEEITYSNEQAQIHIGKRLINPSGMLVQFSNCLFVPQTKFWSARLDTARLRNIEQVIVGKKDDTLTVSLGEVMLKDLQVKKGDSLKLPDLLQRSDIVVKGIQATYALPDQFIRVWNAQFVQNNGLASLQLDSMALEQRKTREAVWAASPYEKAYINLRTGKSNAKQVQLNLNDKKPKLKVGKISIDNLYVVPQKDKTKPMGPIDYRPLLAMQLQQIPFPFKIDSLLLSNGLIETYEIAAKTGEEIFVSFTNLNGFVANIKNFDYRPDDSLRMRVSALLMGKGLLRHQFRQSYTDTLQGFWMRTRMGPMDMRELNRLLEPLLRIRINSGQIDSMLMVVRGNDLLAYGNMDLRYKKLKISRLNPEGEQQYFMSAGINWLINRIVRTNDNARNDVVLQERVRNRGIFGYWARIGAAGLLTNIGVKHDRKQQKQFEKDLRNYNLPDKLWHED